MSIIDDILKTVVMGSDVSTHLQQPIADLNAALAATEVAIQQWQKALSALQIAAAQYGLETRK